LEESERQTDMNHAQNIRILRLMVGLIVLILVAGPSPLVNGNFYGKRGELYSSSALYFDAYVLFVYFGEVKQASSSVLTAQSSVDVIAMNDANISFSCCYCCSCADDDDEWCLN